MRRALVALALLLAGCRGEGPYLEVECRIADRLVFYAKEVPREFGRLVSFYTAHGATCEFYGPAGSRP